MRSGKTAGASEVFEGGGERAERGDRRVCAVPQLLSFSGSSAFCRGRALIAANLSWLPNSPSGYGPHTAANTLSKASVPHYNPASKTFRCCDRRQQGT